MSFYKMEETSLRRKSDSRDRFLGWSTEDQNSDSGSMINQLVTWGKSVFPSEHLLMHLLNEGLDEFSGFFFFFYSDNKNNNKSSTNSDFLIICLIRDARYICMQSSETGIIFTICRQ